jgi:hypothetical protein
MQPSSSEPGRIPEVYIAGTDTLTKRTPLQRSPSVPRDFRPSQFAFLPQPDFQSGREPRQEKNENVSEGETN